MNYSNQLLTNVLNDPSFVLYMDGENLLKADADYFKMMFLKLINKKNIFVDKDLKHYIKTNILNKSEINKEAIETYILFLYLIIHLQKPYLNPDLWCNSWHYVEINKYSLHTKLINLEYFEGNEIIPDMLKILIEKFRRLDNHYIFNEFFIYALQLGLTINLKINMLQFNEIDTKTGLKNRNIFTSYHDLNAINYILQYPPTKKNNNYFDNYYLMKEKEQENEKYSMQGHTAAYAAGNDDFNNMPLMALIF